LNKVLFKHIDNTGLVLWRVVFGLLIAIQAFGEIILGSVKRNFIDPDFTFNFIGFDFLQPLPGNWMYVYFAVMGVFGIGVLLGYKYRWSMFFYALMWTGVYLMQKSSYNNHYYLMMLLCWIMVFLPANKHLSIDAKQNSELASTSMPRWVLLVIILQIWIVYTYASAAKIYPDWLDGTTTALLMQGKKNYWLIGELLQLEWVHYSIAYVGIAFDLLIIPLLLCRKTRMIAFVISIFFHLFNSIIFQIGIFPYMSIAFAFFFFPADTLQRIFLPKKKLYTAGEVRIPNYKNLLIGGLTIYLFIQVALPLRHWFIPDDVLWNEEGHRLSWRMMLRSKSGILNVYIVDKAIGERIKYDHLKLLSKKQLRNVKTKPDLIWQLAQRIKKLEAKEGRDVGVYMDVKIKINGSPYHRLIDPDIDIANVPWNIFTHNPWILPSPKDYHEKAELEKPIHILRDPNAPNTREHKE
jgi:hypothetical protein